MPGFDFVSASGFRNRAKISVAAIASSSSLSRCAGDVAAGSPQAEASPAGYGGVVLFDCVVMVLIS